MVTIDDYISLINGGLFRFISKSTLMKVVNDEIHNMDELISIMIFDERNFINLKKGG
jgi:hypothetical protein